MRSNILNLNYNSNDFLNIIQKNLKTDLRFFTKYNKS